MKAFYLSCLLALCAAPAYSQASPGRSSFEVGLSAGIAPVNRWIAGYDPKAGIYGTLRAGVNLGSHWQAGIGIEALHLSAGYKYLPAAPLGSWVTEEEGRATFAAPLFTGILYANYRQRFGHLTGYLGAAGGYASGNSGVKPDGGKTLYKGGSGPAFGLQLGAVYHISKRVGLCAEVAARRYSLTWDYRSPIQGGRDKDKYTLIALPLSLGVRFAL